MEEVYRRTGMSAFKLWLFELGVEDLKVHFNQARADKLWKMINDYRAVLKDTGSDEEISHLERLLEQINVKKKSQRGIVTNNGKEKLWLCGLGLEQLKKEPNREKAEQMRSWLNLTDFYSSFNAVETRSEVALKKNELRKLLAP